MKRYVGIYGDCEYDERFVIENSSISEKEIGVASLWQIGEIYHPVVGSYDIRHMHMGNIDLSKSFTLKELAESELIKAPLFSRNLKGYDHNEILTNYNIFSQDTLRSLQTELFTSRKALRESATRERKGMVWRTNGSDYTESGWSYFNLFFNSTKGKFLRDRLVYKADCKSKENFDHLYNRYDMVIIVETPTDAEFYSWLPVSPINDLAAKTNFDSLSKFFGSAGKCAYAYAYNEDNMKALCTLINLYALHSKVCVLSDDLDVEQYCVADIARQSGRRW